MATKRKGNSKQQVWARLGDALQENTPQLYAWSGDTEQFNELRIKARPDGTILAIAKGYDSDGGPIVCFGVGYDISACLLAIEATMAGNFWRVEKPWKP